MMIIVRKQPHNFNEPACNGKLCVQEERAQQRHLDKDGLWGPALLPYLYLFGKKLNFC